MERVEISSKNKKWSVVRTLIEIADFFENLPEVLFALKQEQFEGVHSLFKKKIQVNVRAMEVDGAYDLASFTLHSVLRDPRTGNTRNHEHFDGQALEEKVD